VFRYASSTPIDSATTGHPRYSIATFTMCFFGRSIAAVLCAAISTSGMRIGANDQNVVGSSASRPLCTND
jgi:hypothetical protein